MIRFLLLLLALIFTTGLSAQPSTTKKLLWLTGSSAVFSLFDYVGYNATKGSTVYRISQAVVQIGLTYLLYKQLGISSAIAFNVIWWTWGLDLLYYQWGRILPPYDILEKGKQVTWAHFTPVGIFRGSGNAIAHNTLIAQSLFGFVIAVTITI